MTRTLPLLTLAALLATACQTTPPTAAAPPLTTTRPSALTSATPAVLESHDAHGLLTTRTSFDSMEPLRDPAGHSLPGKYLLKNPLITFYQDGHPVSQLKSNTMELTLEPIH